MNLPECALKMMMVTGKQYINMEEYNLDVRLVLKKVPFIPTTGNSGRCIKCAAREYCGSKFPCPCNINEQLILTNIVNENITKEDINDLLKK